MLRQFNGVRVLSEILYDFARSGRPFLRDGDSVNQNARVRFLAREKWT